MNENEKKAAALEALKYVKDKSVIGVGTGSTIQPFIEALNEKVEREHLELWAIPTSTKTGLLLHKRIHIIDWSLDQVIDISVDGADKASRDFFLIKGGGGALLREKFVALNSAKNITIIDESKIATPLWSYPLPVEIVPFGYQSTIRRLHAKGFDGSIRMMGDEFFVTDNHNYIFDIDLQTPITDPFERHTTLKAISGVVETGLFLQTSDIIIIGKNNLSVDVWEKE
jgi:ribose 5-phosphate isomerase A